MAAIKEPPLPTEEPLARPLAADWPLAGLPAWVEEFERTFDNLGWPRAFFPPVLRKGLHERTWVPALEVFEKEGHFVLRADLPGLRREDVHVEIEENRLIVRGEREEEREEKKAHVLRTERTYGAFHRVVPLPEGVTPETAKATFKDGVLEVILDVAPAAQKLAKTVDITA
jgi:HSP20 family protein